MKKAAQAAFLSLGFQNYYFTFANALMHFVHKVLETLRPCSKMEIFWRFALNLRLVALMEKLRLCPKVVVFPQFSHFAIVIISFQNNYLDKNKKVVYHIP
jgi:hypothetical protein